MLNIASIATRGPVYRCRNGKTYRKLSDLTHIPTHWMGGVWVDDGRTERLDPNELVQLVG